MRLQSKQTIKTKQSVSNSSRKRAERRIISQVSRSTDTLMRHVYNVCDVWDEPETRNRTMAFLANSNCHWPLQLLTMLDFYLAKWNPLIGNTHMHTPLNNVTDLRVIGVGGTRATNKFQKEATILLAYGKSTNQDQTRIDQQQEQTTGMGNNGNKKGKKREQKLCKRTCKHNIQPRTDCQIARKLNRIWFQKRRVCSKTASSGDQERAVYLARTVQICEICSNTGGVTNRCWGLCRLLFIQCPEWEKR